MNLKQTLQSEITDQSQRLIKAASFQFLPLIIAGGQILVFWLSGKEQLFPDNDALMNVIGTCAEIIAGLYGITLAGYTFFLSRIDALMATDATLDYIVSAIKQRFKFLIWYITGTVATTLFISVFLMCYPADSGGIPPYLYRVICTEFLLFLIFSASLILYYGVAVVDPNCLEKEARRLKRKLGGGLRFPGDAAAFISLYDRIEQRCNSLLPENVLSQIRENKGRHFEYTIALLQEQNQLNRPLIADIRRIHRYYECTMNCAPLTVSQDMCVLARQVLTALEQLSLPQK